ncbi:hypothetical protein [Streptomonospora salina]|uniref:Uncharacterized protein n=1 Tax=Streptomonospora salina TaxID=104205 RepID=A0A841EHL9_9ACTN|nr:hypothetical protein [Streptomonospora salina]MBB6000869.1 hypothetical protein [Streptomonospora salina]
MAELETTTTHTVTLTAEELEALRTGMSVAVSATVREPSKHKHRPLWQRLAHVGKATREQAPAEGERRLPVWGAPTTARNTTGEAERVDPGDAPAEG